MILDTAITMRDLIEIGVLVGGGIVTVTVLRSSVGFMRREMAAVQSEIKKIGEILTKLAVTNERQDNADRRLSRVEDEVADLRHGRGFVQGSRGIDREYDTNG